MSTGGKAPTDIALGFAASPEREALRVTANYDSFLDRTPSQSEVTYWVNRFVQGSTNEDLLAAFVGNPEYFNAADKGHANDTTWLNTAYNQLLDRPPTSADVTYWTAILKNAEHAPPVL